MLPDPRTPALKIERELGEFSEFIRIFIRFDRLDPPGNPLGAAFYFHLLWRGKLMNIFLEEATVVLSLRVVPASSRKGCAARQRYQTLGLAER